MEGMTPALFVALLLPMGCQATGVVTTGERPGGETTSTDDTGIESVGEVEEEGWDPDDPEQSAWIFSLDQVHTVDIHLPAESFAELASWPASYTWDMPYDYVVGDVTVDGEPLDEVGVRLKGRWGSYRPLSGKPSLKVDVNRYLDQDFHGLKKLTFNNMIYDYPGVQEHLAYLLFRTMGVPAPRTAYAWVTINGEDYGLYNWIENYDGTFDDQHLGGGNLYEADYVVYPDYSYLTVDFESASQDHFDLKAGEDVELADVYAVTEVLETWGGDPRVYDEAAPLIDWAHHHRYWATEFWIGHIDGYTNNSNNFYAWFEPDGGRVRLLPWDMHYTFVGSSSAWYAVGQISLACLHAPACTTDLLLTIDQVCAELDALELDAELHRAMELIEEPYWADPRRETPDGYITAYQDAIYDWVELRSGQVRDAWGIPGL